MLNLVTERGREAGQILMVLAAGVRGQLAVVLFE
jgi:hypothetical protein